MQLAVTVSQEFSLDPALVCAHIDVRSQWNSGAAAVPGAIHHIQNSAGPLEAEYRAIQWGLMGISGEFARQENFAGPLPSLLDPKCNLREGCRLLLALCRAVRPSQTPDKRGLVLAIVNWNRQPDEFLARLTLQKLEGYREMIARLASLPHAFPHADTIPPPLSSQIEDNLLLEVGVSMHTQTTP